MKFSSSLGGVWKGLLLLSENIHWNGLLKVSVYWSALIKCCLKASYDSKGSLVFLIVSWMFFIGDMLINEISFWSNLNKYRHLQPIKMQSYGTQYQRIQLSNYRHNYGTANFARERFKILRVREWQSFLWDCFYLECQSQHPESPSNMTV